MSEILDYYRGVNKSRSHWELETVYQMARAYVTYAFCSKDTKAPSSSVTMEDEEYLSVADGLFGVSE